MLVLVCVHEQPWGAPPRLTHEYFTFANTLKVLLERIPSRPGPVELGEFAAAKAAAGAPAAPHLAISPPGPWWHVLRDHPASRAFPARSSCKAAASCQLVRPSPTLTMWSTSVASGTASARHIRHHGSRRRTIWRSAATVLGVRRSSWRFCSLRRLRSFARSSHTDQA